MPRLYLPGGYPNQPKNGIPQLKGEFAGATFVYVPAFSMWHEATRYGSIASGTAPTLGHHGDASTAHLSDTSLTFSGTQGLSFTTGMTVLAVGSYFSATGAEINNLVSREAGGTAGGFTVDLYNRFGGTPARLYSAYNKPGVGDTNWDSVWVGLRNGTSIKDSTGNGSFDTTANTRYAVATTTATGPAASSATDIDIGMVAGWPSKVDVELVVIWPRKFNERQLQRISADPYSIFQAPRRTLFNAASTSAYELSVDPTTYAITAAAETLIATRALSIDPASYSLTAAAETLSVGRAVNFAPASYSLTAAAETLTATRNLSIDPASYALSAAAETLSVGRALSVDPASYALTTSAETLTVGRALSIDPAAYSLSAADVEFERTVVNPVLSIDPASYVLSLPDVALSFGSSLQLLGGGPGGPRKRRKGGTESYLERLLGRPLDEYEPEEIEQIEEAVEEAIEEAAKAPELPAVSEVENKLKAYDLAFREAYVQIYLQMVAERRQQQEDEEIMAIIAMSL